MTMDSDSDRNTPRYYIHTQNENVEFTAYFWLARSAYFGGSSTSTGPTLVVRSNHDLYKSDPCQARSYYMRFSVGNKNLYFLKEIRHGSSTKYSTFSPKGPSMASFPWGQWVGLKFVVRTLPSGDVKLQSFIDLSNGNDGGDWQQQLEVTDFASDAENTHGCPHASIYPDGGVAFIRADKMHPVKWKSATLREVGNSTSNPSPW
eukprot:TRINITY_DN77301_c0_g1_i1.p2 TRINITY_DN77301_c0_g1~~TRINITY_DN77301_c0_g1_i1.p2  ORF type:complete len:204 (+),score=20.53 TRINITY_DN77301_c0_g1_i1:1478-2089(+)